MGNWELSEIGGRGRGEEESEKVTQKERKMVGNSKKTAENIKYKYRRNFINYLKNTYHIKLT